MPKNPHVLILMATYNGEQFISDQIESILNQTYKNWKLVIHDDGSTDNTLDIINKYAEKYKDKIILIDDGIKCGGAKENFSHLIKIAKNSFDFDYIMFADQDDVWLPEKIEITLNKMVDVKYKVGEDKPILIHTDLKVVDERLNVMAESFWKYQKINPQHNTFNRVLVQNIVTGCTTMINKSALYICFPIPEKAILHDWWMALVVSAFGKIDYVSKPTVLYRQHANNDIGAKKWDVRSAVKRVFKKNELKRFKNNFVESIKQGEAMLRQYNNSLSFKNREILKAYVSLLELNPLVRCYLVYKYKFYKSGILRNIGSIILTLFI